MRTIYIESAIKHHPRAQSIIQKYATSTRIIECDSYPEIFNVKQQNFRLQKQQTSLILAEKKGRKVLPTPEGFGIGGEQNYYFSHMLNCIYDCRYCFLQGMYASAHQVLFINYEDFMADIASTAAADRMQKHYFFSGYDCDSLAFDAVSGFLPAFLPFFQTIPNAILELRTKSTQVRSLLEHQPFDNCVVAFSFTPQQISQQVEHKVPAVSKRISAMRQVAEHGWKVGLRLDPLINIDNFEKCYTNLLAEIFENINPKQLHSISIGPLRFPKKMFDKISKLYATDKLLAQPMQQRGKDVSYAPELEQQLKATVIAELQKYVPNTLLFECNAL